MRLSRRRNIEAPERLKLVIVPSVQKDSAADIISLINRFACAGLSQPQRIKPMSKNTPYRILTEKFSDTDEDLGLEFDKTEYETAFDDALERYPGDKIIVVKICYPADD
jgi:hypothetical protein